MDPSGCPKGYRELISPSIKLPGLTQGRDSGGMLIWYRSNLGHAIKVTKTVQFYTWLEINKSFTATVMKTSPPACLQEEMCVCFACKRMAHSQKHFVQGGIYFAVPIRRLSTVKYIYTGAYKKKREDPLKSTKITK